MSAVTKTKPEGQSREELVVEVSGLAKTFYTGFVPYRFLFRAMRAVSSGFANLAAKEVKAVRGLSFDVKKGEVFGLLGPNGAGKTTTLKIMMGLLFPDQGQIRLFGRPVGDLSAKTRIGFLPENPYFYDYLKPQEFLDLVARLTDVKSSVRAKRIEEMLELVGLTNAKDRPLRKFSKGMLQRIGLAQAIINDPDLVILDEPLSGLDPIGRKEMRDLIVRLGKRGKTVLFSSHILSDVEMLCDRVAIMVQGKLSSVGPLDELLFSDVEETEVYVDEASDELVEGLRAMDGARVEQTGKKVQLRLPGNEKTGAVLKLVLEAGGSVVSVLPRKRSLEDLFVAQATGQKTDGETGKGN